MRYEKVDAPVDRCTYLEEGSDIIDEVVMHNASVHLEALDETTYMLIMDNGSRRLHLNIFPKSGRAKIVARMQEDISVGQEGMEAVE